MSSNQNTQNSKESLKWVDQIVLDIIKTHSKDIQLDEQKFLDLLRESLSLDAIAKKEVLSAVPNLVQWQFDELQKVFTEERETLADLAKKYPDDIIKMVEKQKSEWKKLWEIYKMEAQAKQMKAQDDEQVAALKKSLGL